MKRILVLGLATLVMVACADKELKKVRSAQYYWETGWGQYTLIIAEDGTVCRTVGEPERFIKLGVVACDWEVWKDSGEVKAEATP